MNRPALTLIELLLVLAVLASAACMALPSLLGTQRHLQLRSQAAELADDLRGCRQLAIDQATTICVGLQNDGGKYWHYDLHQPAARQEKTTGSGITLNRLDVSGSPTEFCFRPDGSAQDCQIEVRAPQASMRLTIERLTGNVTLEDMP